MNVLGAPIATCACYAVMIVMNMIFLKKYLVGCRRIIPNTLRTAAAALVMGAAAYFMYKPLSLALGMKLGGAVAIIISAAVYGALVLFFKIVTVRELKSILKK